MAADNIQWSASIFEPLPSGASADEAWSLVGDFATVNRWLPDVPTCHIVEGPAGAVGCVRYVAAPLAEDGSDLWAKEKLVELDPADRSYSYAITESNVFGRYEAKLGVVVDPGAGGCGLEWRVDADPVPGMTRERLVGYLEGGLKAMADRVGDALRQAKGKESLQP